MSTPVEPTLIRKLQGLSSAQVAEVEDFIEFLSAKSRKRAALDRLVKIAPAIEAAGGGSLSEDEIASEVQAARQARRAGGAAPATDAHRP